MIAVSSTSYVTTWCVLTTMSRVKPAVKNLKFLLSIRWCSQNNYQDYRTKKNSKEKLRKLPENQNLFLNANHHCHLDSHVNRVVGNDAGFVSAGRMKNMAEGQSVEGSL